MKYIKKSDEPEDLAKFKASANEDWQPTYNDLRSKEKTNIHQKLLEEQGYICCYCGMEIDKENSHIEHLKPRSIFSEEQLNYNNLLASCQREREKKEPPHCGVKKADWYEEKLMLSPLKPNCSDFFRYTGSGEILPANVLDKKEKEIALTTIDKLGLDIDKLNAMRKAAIDGILEVVENLEKSEIKELLDSFDKLDNQGKYIPFCAVITYIIQEYFIGEK
ncbi:retron system putative HNH endonuclease [Okeania sp. SIO1I7]|uniref:retron system putative HNH endonuclease n=1 Tax=Okeania sp. SIO1I7 TaxID=2607772 RepID=UPI0013FA1EEC|nr:retron system putative HNH endonuclease [Okeania sp. SIO1I7]NET25883.1 TIGR02646 family protein [Okeania sp. SIO1I7]